MEMEKIARTWCACVCSPLTMCRSYKETRIHTESQARRRELQLLTLTWKLVVMPDAQKQPEGNNIGVFVCMFARECSATPGFHSPFIEMWTMMWMPIEEDFPISSKLLSYEFCRYRLYFLTQTIHHRHWFHR